ncbi:tyrosine-type recombinase/integrase [Nocardia sp. NPDC059246]|uniref:tyrosine-type recombinase/integrase n=1 Tax=unclassified Nocardia TaxID=2637762 RepID=UPI00369B5D51
MASIRERVHARGNTTYQLQYRYNGKQPSIEFDDRADAVKWKAIFEKRGPAMALEMLRAESADATCPGIKQAGADYIETRTKAGVGSRQRYERFMRNDIEPFFTPTLPVDSVTPEMVAKWINHLAAKGNSAKTIANKHGYLCGMFKWLAKKGTVSTNPCVETELPDIHQAEMTFLEADEFAALHREIPAEWQVFVRFLVTSGVRWGEATALRVGDVSRKAGTVRIRQAWKYTGGKRILGPPKTKKSKRTINIDRGLLDALPLTGRAYGDWLFTNAHGDPVQISTFYKTVWVPTLARLAADPEDPLRGKSPRIHDLRHTCASWMISKRVSLPVIQAALGHESITTTVDRYGHLDRQAGEAAAAAIGEILTEHLHAIPVPAAQVVALRSKAVA